MLRLMSPRLYIIRNLMTSYDYITIIAGPINGDVVD